MLITKNYINNRTLNEFIKFKEDIIMMNIDIISKLLKIFDEV